MTNLRWLIEIRKMERIFPGFQPFVQDGKAGFAGFLRGKSGREYQITIDALAKGYPSQTPNIWINPFVGPNRFANGSLCVHRRWDPTRDTFAQQVLYAADYLLIHG
jgi:hypothetical protein